MCPEKTVCSYPGYFCRLPTKLQDKQAYYVQQWIQWERDCLLTLQKG